MNLKSLILLSLVLASCNRKLLPLQQAQILQTKYPGAAVGTLRDGSSGPSAVVKKADGSVWLFVFSTQYVVEPCVEEELIPAAQ